MFPTVAELTKELAHHKRWLRTMFSREEFREGGDVRLQVTDGGWALRTGDSSYDLDHSGYWGAGWVGPGTNCRELARELINEARDHKAQCE